MSIKTVLLEIAKGLGVFALCRTISKNKPRILCYHAGSLGDEHLFNAKLFCRRGLLEQRLQWLERKGFVSRTLDDLFQPHSGGGIPVTVTLDDGWYSSATDLLPLLARYRYQPVLYLATKVFAQGGPVVDVSLRYILWKSPLKAAQLSGFSPALDGDHALDSRVQRDRFCNTAEQWLASFDGDAAALEAALVRLSIALGVPAAELDLPSRRFSYMNRDELLAAAEAGCKIELHGHAHRYLKGESERNHTDIELCRQHIVAAGLPVPRHYCYPSGDYDAQAPEVLTAAGVTTATTCRPGLVHNVDRDGRYFLPRFLDGGDVTMIEFEAEMSGVLEFVRRIAGRSSA